MEDSSGYLLSEEWREVFDLCEVGEKEKEILGYFSNAYTNAFAESLNSKIQRFVRSNFGIRYRHFFHFRLSRYFSSHIKKGFTPIYQKKT